MHCIIELYEQLAIDQNNFEVVPMFDLWPTEMCLEKALKYFFTVVYILGKGNITISITEVRLNYLLGIIIL